MIERHSWPWTLWAHLSPGVLGVFFFALVARWGAPRGLPPSFALFLAMLVVLVPCELGVLIHAGRRHAGDASLGPLIPYTERLSLLQYSALVPPLLVWSFFCFFFVAPRETRFLEGVLSWSPDWLTGAAGPPSYSRSALIVTWALGLAVNGFALPVVEELYFRGYLLPRIPADRRWSPLLNTVLFSLYHLFSPAQNLTRILAATPMAYAVAWKRSVYVGIATHCSLNTLAMLIALRPLLR
jgi:membrane protease YdiL (CAAX protease family)